MDYYLGYSRHVRSHSRWSLLTAGMTTGVASQARVMNERRWTRARNGWRQSCREPAYTHGDEIVDVPLDQARRAPARGSRCRSPDKCCHHAARGRGVRCGRRTWRPSRGIRFARGCGRRTSRQVSSNGAPVGYAYPNVRRVRKITPGNVGAVWIGGRSSGDRLSVEPATAPGDVGLQRRASLP